MGGLQRTRKREGLGELQRGQFGLVATEEAAEERAAEDREARAAAFASARRVFAYDLRRSKELEAEAEAQQSAPLRRWVGPSASGDLEARRPGMFRCSKNSLWEVVRARRASSLGDVQMYGALEGGVPPAAQDVLRHLQTQRPPAGGHEAAARHLRQGEEDSAEETEEGR